MPIMHHLIIKVQNCLIPSVAILIRRGQHEFCCKNVEHYGGFGGATFRIKLQNELSQF